MTIFSTLSSFFRRNRKKVIISSSIIAIIYFGIGFLKQKFIDYQLKLAEERFSREQIRRRFEQTQKDSLYTIYALVPVLASPIFDSLPVEEITKALQARRLDKKGLGGSGIGASTIGDDNSSTTTEQQQHQVVDGETSEKKTKNELWSDLKSQSLTRFLTLLYSNALLILFTRLQLNILARREYLEDALKVAATKHGFNERIDLVDNTNNESLFYVNEQAYLSFSWWLLNRGWIQIRERVKSAVDEVFEEINPRAELSLDDFAILLSKTQQIIESPNTNNSNNELDFISSVLLPPENLETFVVQQTLDEENIETLSKDNTILRTLIDETKNYVQSSSSLIVLSSLINVGITTLLNNIALTLSSRDPSQESPNEIKVKLAILLANITKASNDFKNGTRSDYINNMDKVTELDELSASVYSNFEI
ncbi:Peroxisomal biogenesis factor 3 [Wickerhamomyces ciferrii]|uniref:Peroxin-3 n=1 Tax=Wickerhamomyces ciferrii (strain ATCC 14091 / BCRC 22168 / CBS 111 / JCM 3599 / NBRC 0793 / NRRL Y-1031 F-60-10) TaxID=1206466 RepID=K0KM34_WICCF|nr:Peroxisomal biogenesis factor 3 [Wickerhamomyces ciferrii]CCH44061.1 Peroxisomal biogenesis factor 3 [Wickerhamomyces ciferrii]